MSKKINNEDEVEVEVEVPLSNIVQLEDGSIVDFKKSGKVVSTYDVNSNEVTFKTVTGKVHMLNISTLPDSVLREATIYGIREKIKSTLPPVPPEGLSDKILNEFASLQAGKFTTRGTDSGSIELDSFLKSFALINATGVVNTGSGTFDVPQAFIAVNELRPNWINVHDINVINEVNSFWNSLSKKDKSSQKRNTFVTTQENLIESGALDV